ncbi:MAG: hypothetical protein JO058_03995 [Alphaproteobacteria bacterium]|nr:hypothetical protein [Alphaproteobacteria bacterium]
MPTQNETAKLDPDKLRELAAWYREFAERAEPSVREHRLRIAEQLERDADVLDQRPDAALGMPISS